MEGQELVVLRQLVGGREQRQQRDVGHLAAVVEASLVDERQDGVQDRRARLEDLIQERDVGLRQLVGREPAVVVLLERLQADRAEQLLRRREARQQPLEVGGPVDPPADLVGEHRLGGAGRPDHQHMLRRDERHERAVDQLVPLEEDLLQLVPDGAQDVTRRRHERRIAEPARGRQARNTPGLSSQYACPEGDFDPDVRPAQSRALFSGTPRS